MVMGIQVGLVSLFFISFLIELPSKKIKAARAANGILKILHENMISSIVIGILQTIVFT